MIQIETQQLRTDNKIIQLGLDQHSSHLAWIKKAKKNDKQLIAILEQEDSDSETTERLMDLEWDHFSKALNCKGLHFDCAIDAVLLVCRRLNQDEVLFYPSIMAKLKELNADAFDLHLKRIGRLVELSLIENLAEGQLQGYYRDDMSSDLISRLFLSRFLDLYDPGAFAPEDYNYKKLYRSIIHSFISGILTKKGVAYYEKQLTEIER